MLTWQEDELSQVTRATRPPGQNSVYDKSQNTTELRWVRVWDGVGEVADVDENLVAEDVHVQLVADVQDEIKQNTGPTRCIKISNQEIH